MQRQDYLAFGKPNFSTLEIEAVTRVLSSGWIGMGPETIAFEAELAAFLGVPHVVTVNSCTAALFLSLHVAGVQAGDEVICPSLTWCSTANAALYLGATPVFCDVDPETLCASPEQVRACVTERTKAVVVVHFGGYPMDMAALRAALPERVAIVEDAAHAFNSRMPDGRLVGASGNLACFSFYANKNLSTGEGGAIALTDRATAERLQSLRQHALPVDAWKRYSHPTTMFLSGHLTELGYKMNFTDLNAAIGRVQLSRQREFSEIRAEIALRYESRLRGHGFGLQSKCTAAVHAKHLFTVQLPLEKSRRNRNEAIAALRAQNIGASIHYLPLHHMPLYRDSVRQPLPHTDRVTERIMTLPISASMTTRDADRVCNALIEVIA